MPSLCLDASRLNTRIFQQRNTQSQDSVYGEMVDSWLNVRGLWCEVMFKQSRERLEQSQTRGHNEVDIRCRYFRDVYIDDRILLPANPTTLNGGIDDSVTTVTVDDSTFLWGDKERIIRIEDELLTVSAGYETTSLTVTRGAFGTSAAAHADEATAIYMRPYNIDGIENVHNENVELVLKCIAEF